MFALKAKQLLLLTKNWDEGQWSLHSRLKPFRKILELCMETPCRCPSEGHQHGSRNVTETCLSLSFAPTH